MKFQALCAVAMASGVTAIASNAFGVNGDRPLSLLELFQQRTRPVPENEVGPMLKSAESMLMDLARNHKGTPLSDLVDQIRPFIRQMQDSINAAHSSAQQTLTTFGNDFSGCNDAKNGGESEAANLQNTTRSHSQDHKSCRTRQKAADDQYSACDATLQALKGAMDSSCQLYENAKLEPGCHAIPPNAGETWESYVSRAAVWFPQTRDDFLHKKEVCNNDTTKYEDQRAICLGPIGSVGGQKKILDDTVEECDGIQHQLESATCSYVSKVRAVCESFGVCVNTLADAFDNQKAGIETLEHQRQVEWNATERLLCLLDVYGADGGVDATKLQTCQHIADNTTHLRLVWPTPTPRPAPCPDYLPHPCNDDYKQLEYAGMDAPAGTCTACSFPGPTAGPTAGPPQAVGFQYVGCFNGGTVTTREPDVPPTVAGVHQCNDACVARGFTFFSFECPHGNEVHCECGSTQPSARDALPDASCHTFNTASGAHCSGPFMVGDYTSEYSMGAGSINAVYRTKQN